MSPGDLNTQLLLNVGQQLAAIERIIGNIQARLDAGSEKHKEFSEQLDMIDRRTDIIEDKIVKVEGILIPTDGTKPVVLRIKNIENFIGRQGMIIGAASAILVGAVTLIGWALSAFKDDIMHFFRR